MVQIRLPWTLNRLPEAVPIGLALFLLATALGKAFVPNYLCGPNRFAAANALMFPVELSCAVLLRRPGAGRRFAALLMTLLMPGTAAFLTLAHLRGYDVRSCGCFGPVELPYPAHIVVCAAVCAASALVLLREEGRARVAAAFPAP